MRRIMLALAGFLAMALAPSAQDDKQKEADAKKKIDDFKASVGKAKKDDEVITALGTLGDMQHVKILSELKGWLARGSSEIRLAAAEQIAKYAKNKEAAEALLAGTGGQKDVNVLKVTVTVKK